jgi:hypothetical protein
MEPALFDSGKERIMKKILALMLLAAVIVLSGCFVVPFARDSETAPAADPTRTPRPSASAAPSSPSALPSKSAALPSASAAALSGYSFADAKEVYANPDAYKGMEYASPFMLAGGRQSTGDSVICYAEGYNNGSQTPSYAVLEFSGDRIPDLVTGSAMYIRGVIKGKSTLYGDSGSTIDALWLSVTEWEADAGGAAALPASHQEFRFEEGECRAIQDSLSIEVIGLTFSDDGLMLSTKTKDSAAKGLTTYYVDVIIHQDSRFAWYHGCNFWINGSTVGYDNIPFPSLDSKTDMTVDFVPYSEAGALLYRPLVIDIPLSAAAAP